MVSVQLTCRRDCALCSTQNQQWLLIIADTVPRLAWEQSGGMTLWVELEGAMGCLWSRWGAWDFFFFFTISFSRRQF